MTDYTRIQSDATYFFIIVADDDTAPVLLMVKGKDLYTAAIQCKQNLTIENGIKFYLNNFETIDGLEHMKIEVHKLTTRPIVTLDYRPATQEALVVERDD